MGALDLRLDAKPLDNVKSKKSLQLLQYSRDLEAATVNVCELIEKYMKYNKRYYGRVFCYEGTDYVTSVRREMEEIRDIVLHFIEPAKRASKQAKCFFIDIYIFCM